MAQSVVTVTEPQTYLDTALSSTPATGPTTLLGATDDLQAALNAAKPGDRILLSPGVVWSGNFTIPMPQAGGNAGEWIWVMTAGSMPTEGTRITDTVATSMQYPTIRSNSLLPALKTAASNACTKWRFMGITIDVDPSVSTTRGSVAHEGLVWLGDSDSTQNSLTLVPSDIIFDRCWAHGFDTLDCRKAFAFNASRLALIESRVDTIHSGFDAQAVTCSNGPGPHKITNNYLEAGGEVIAYGGAPIWIDQMIVADVEIRHNFLTKPLAWAGTWNTKNLIEFKFGRRILIEGNVGDNSKCDGQQGFAIVLWSANADSPGNTWAVTEHVTVRENQISITSAGINLIDHYNSTIPNLLNHVAIVNNAFIGIDSASVQCFGRVFNITGQIDNLSIEHNTGFSPTSSSFLWGGGAKLVNHVVRNNLVGGPFYALFAAGAGMNDAAWTAVAGSGSIFLGNVVAYASGIAGNNFPATFDAIGLAGGGSKATDPTATLANLTLSPAGTYSGTATDGTDPGADMTALAAAIANVSGGTSGSGTGTVTPTPSVLTTLTLAPSTLTVTAGATGSLNTTAADQNSATMAVPTLTASSTSPGVATVTVSGSVVTVTGVAQGTATITVANGTVTSNGCVVTVNAASTGTGQGGGVIKNHPIHPPHPVKFGTSSRIVGHS